MAWRTAGVLMAGRLIYIMGPSGAGKDAVLQGLMGLMVDDDCYWAPRLVTRPTMHKEACSVSVSLPAFARLEANGSLALQWRAHGLASCVPPQTDHSLQAGCGVKTAELA